MQGLVEELLSPDLTDDFEMVHSTFAAACLFLIADLVVTRRASDSLQAVPATVQNGLFAALFFATAIAMAGMPPLSGFLGKLLVMDALRAPETMSWAWSAILVGSFLTIVGFARAGSALFWKSTAIDAPDDTPAPDGTLSEPANTLQVAPVLLGVLMLGALAIFAGPVTDYLNATSDQLFNRDGYVGAVLRPEQEG